MASRRDTQDGKGFERVSGAVDRRAFLAAATGLASTALLPGTAEAAGTAAGVNRDRTPARLALEGGELVRSTMLEGKLPGPQYYDDEERRELLDVLENRSPFRWWGSDPKGRPPDKCINFEKEFAAHHRHLSSLRRHPHRPEIYRPGRSGHHCRGPQGLSFGPSGGTVRRHNKEAR